MAQSLNQIERRVLGVLLEKSLAQPTYYPMTLNAVVAACNQKSNRDPVMSLDDDTVWNTLEVLRAAGLVARILPGAASRVERFKHAVKDLLGWEKPQRAVMAELLLRGPQTAGELRSRCGRMYPFENTDAVAAVLDNLTQADPPIVGTLARSPGQSAVRHAHRLYEPDEWATLTRERAGGDAVPAATANQRNPASTSGRPDSANPTDEVAELRRELADLRRRVETLERHTGLAGA
ncbi:MAG: YceH family protein [Planctomycetes bacterium]|nr:YceH family protein [Planctomycetota bacterium]